MADSTDLSLHALGSETSSGNGTSTDLEQGTYPLRRVAQLKLRVTAASGTDPTLDVKVQTSTDASVWRDVASFTQASDATEEEKFFGELDAYVRVVWTIGGTDTPTFTFSVLGVADELYATVSECAQWGLPSDVLDEVGDSVVLGQLMAASQDARSYLLGHFNPPFTSVGPEVRKNVCRVAIEGVLCNNIGIDPNPTAAELVVKQADDARSWFKQVSMGRATASVTDSTPTTYEGSGWAATNNASRRGWGDNGVI
jgi:phage gp36-like protein